MGTEILKSFGVLQNELEQAKNSLKGVDENIKRLIGRDPSEIVPRPGTKRVLSTEENSRGRPRTIPLNRNRNLNHENDEPSNKRRNVSVFKRLSERPIHYEEEIPQQPQKQLISKVIVTPREVPSRQEALAAQSTDEKSKARNRRMFGALLGTLQKFQQEETKLKSKEQKRAQVEKKIEEHEIREKAEIKKERQELFFNRKKKQAEIKMIELKMTRMREYAAWEERQKPRANFILTKGKPQICYLPRRLNEANKALLETCKAEVEKSIEKRRQEVFTELQHIEDRMKRNFEPRKPKELIQEESELQELQMETDSKNENMNITALNDSINENSHVYDNSSSYGNNSVNNISDKMEDENTILDGGEIVNEPMKPDEQSQVNETEQNLNGSHLKNLETNCESELMLHENVSEQQFSCIYDESNSVDKGDSD